MKDMEIDDELIMKLDHQLYELRAVYARCLGIKKRIIDEWVLHKPAGELYGLPPVMLSQPLTEEVVKKMLSGLQEHIKSIPFV